MPKINNTTTAPAAAVTAPKPARNIKNILTNLKNIVIYDYPADMLDGNGNKAEAADTQVVRIPKKYNLKKKDTKPLNASLNAFNPNRENNEPPQSLNSANPTFTETFEAIRREKKEKAEKVLARQRPNGSIAADTADEKRRGLNILGASKRVIALLFAAVCGGVMMPFGMNPLGIALICAADKYIFYIYSGLLISLIFMPETSSVMVFFGVYTVVSGVKIYLKYIKDTAKTQMFSQSSSYRRMNPKDRFNLLRLVHFNDSGSVITAVLVCAVASSVVGFLALALNIETLIYLDIIVILLFCLTAMLFTYLFSGLFEAGVGDKVLEKAGLCAVIFTVVYAVAPLYLLTLSLGFILSLALTLTAANSASKTLYRTMRTDNIKAAKAKKQSDEEIIDRFSTGATTKEGTLSDMTRGALTGLLCGIALGDSAGAVILGLCGLVSGLFFAQSKALAIIAGVVSASSYSIYLTGMDSVTRYIPNIIAGFALYLPARAAYMKILENTEKRLEAGEKTSPIWGNWDKSLLMTELPAGKLSTISEAFGSLSVIFNEFAERMKLPAPTEIKMMAQASFDLACTDCSAAEHCRLARADKSSVSRKCADFIKHNKRLEVEGIARVYVEECVKIDWIRARINELYSNRIEKSTVGSKTDIFAANFESISKLLQNNIKSGKDDIAFKKDIGERIYAKLENMGIECDNVIVVGERRKMVYVFGIKMVNFGGSIQDITQMLERLCGTRFGEPEYVLRENYVIMKVISCNKFRVYSVQASKSAGELRADEQFPVKSAPIQSIKRNAINGDSISVFDGIDGFCYGLISDGMGSGRNAALSSRLTSLMMEKLLAAGNQKDLTLEMLNSLLLAKNDEKNDECFASVDLFEADLISGTASFIKAGAAPSFIIRDGRLFKIQSSTVPAGIIPGINSEQTKFELEIGDYILMLSDGIISTFEEGAWLFEMLERQNLSDPQNLLDNILSEAAKRNPRKDDMSILFMRVASA